MMRFISLNVRLNNTENTDWLYVYDWIFEKGNSTIFEKAFLEGYTVKEEQLYEV